MPKAFTNILIIVAMILYRPLAAHAWQSFAIKGQVADAASGAGIPQASVFVNNSTFGTVCGDDGTFTLTQHPAFPFTLSISSVGYESLSRTITSEDVVRNLHIKLTAKQQDLGEVTVRPPEKNGWALYGQTFMQEFIGYSDFAGKCTILNKEALQFSYNPESFQLRVWSEVPLKIRNKATGYEITYWLEDFKLDQRTHRLYYRGSAQFRDLQPDKPQKKYLRNRHSAYLGSINHFMRALYRGTAAAEGFEIRTLVRMTEDDAAALQPTQTDTIAVTDSVALSRLFHIMYDGSGTSIVKAAAAIMAVKKWTADTTIKTPIRIEVTNQNDTATKAFYLFSKMEATKNIIVKHFHNNSPNAAAEPVLLNPGPKITQRNITGLPKLRKPLLDYLYTNIVPADSIIRRQGQDSVLLHFSNFLHVTFTAEMEETAYLKKRFPFKQVKPGPQQSVLGLFAPAVNISADGNFSDPYDLITEQYWSYEKLDKLLPLDYKPE